jgi:hypothetical protein
VVVVWANVVAWAGDAVVVVTAPPPPSVVADGTTVVVVASEPDGEQAARTRARTTNERIGFFIRISLCANRETIEVVAKRESITCVEGRYHPIRTPPLNEDSLV